MPAGDAPSSAALDLAFDELSRSFDPVHGGFGQGTKFRCRINSFFCCAIGIARLMKRALAMVQTTLRGMRAGGIFDQVGFGFHRYSTDEKWLVPHFEKMLYDQALLLLCYVEAFEATRDSFSNRQEKRLPRTSSAISPPKKELSFLRRMLIQKVKREILSLDICRTQRPVRRRNGVICSRRF